MMNQSLLWESSSRKKIKIVLGDEKEEHLDLEEHMGDDIVLG